MAVDASTGVTYKVCCLSIFEVPFDHASFSTGTFYLGTQERK
jgi:hypothetical protein